MRQLRERGIYKTPDGKEFVACAGILGYYLLYSTAKGVNGIPSYVVEVSGRIVTAAQPTPWWAAELSDTGRTFLDLYATPRKSEGTTEQPSLTASGRGR